MRELRKVCSPIFLKCLYLSRIGRPTTFWSVNKLARAVTKWTRACDRRLARLISFIHNTSGFRQYFHVEILMQNADRGYFKTRMSLVMFKTRSRSAPGGIRSGRKRKKLISGILKATLTDFEKDKLIQELHNSCNNQYTPLSEDAKMMIYLRENKRRIRIMRIVRESSMYSLLAIFSAR